MAKVNNITFGQFLMFVVQGVGYQKKPFENIKTYRDFEQWIMTYDNNVPQSPHIDPSTLWDSAATGYRKHTKRFNYEGIYDIDQ